MRARVLGLVAAAVLAGPLAAQERTLADLKQDLAVVSVELQKLKRELSTTGAPQVQIGGDVLQRLNAIEAELQRAVAKTENLEFRIGEVARDGANRIGDLRFRICELEPGCDIGSLDTSSPLGGEQAATSPPPPPAGGSATASFAGELAVSEEADFRSAEEALERGDDETAARLFARFRENYPMGPLEPAALIGEGRALNALGDTREAARRFLDAYSNFSTSPLAPEALWRLGVALGALGSQPEACVTLAEVANRYPQSDFVAAAQASQGELGCL